MAFFHLFSGKEREDVTHGEFCALPVYFSAPPPPPFCPVAHLSRCMLHLPRALQHLLPNNPCKCTTCTTMQQPTERSAVSNAPTARTQAHCRPCSQHR